jgi:acyl-CoA synthetase (AMP-forming)/AMP-acid ligase II
LHAGRVYAGHTSQEGELFYEVWFGAAKSGHVLAPLNWRLAPPELAYIVNDAQAEVLFVGDEFLPLGLHMLISPPLWTR